MAKHLLGILLVALVISIPTMPLVHWVFGSAGVKIYGAFVLPELSIFGYVAYLLLLDD